MPWLPTASSAYASSKNKHPPAVHSNQPPVLLLELEREVVVVIGAPPVSGVVLVQDEGMGAIAYYHCGRTFGHCCSKWERRRASKRLYVAVGLCKIL